MRLFSLLTLVPLPLGKTRPLPKLLSTQYHHSTHSWLSTPSSYLIFSKRVREIHMITEGLEYIKLHCKSHSVRRRWWFIHTYSNRQLTPLLSMPRCIQLDFPLPGLLLNRSVFRMPSKVWMWDLVDIPGLLPAPHPHVYTYSKTCRWPLASTSELYSSPIISKFYMSAVKKSMR